MRSVVAHALGLFAMCSSVAAQQPFFLAHAQEEDGHWSAASCGGKPEADLHVNALMLLRLLAEGRTERTDRRELARGLQWLVAQQDEKGRFLLRAEPTWLFDHAMATYAVAEELRLAERWRGPSVDVALRAAAALREALPVVRPAPSVELRLWTEMIARSLRGSAKAVPAAAETAATATSLHASADELAKVLTRLTPIEPQTPRDRAAARLLFELQTPGAVASDKLPPEWPADALLDPLATFYSTTFVYLHGGKVWTQASAILGRQVVKARMDGAAVEITLRGSWQPVGPFGEQNGRLGTTAGALLLTGIYYRYCRLEVCSGN